MFNILSAFENLYGMSVLQFERLILLLKHLFIDREQLNLDHKIQQFQNQKITYFRSEGRGHWIFVTKFVAIIIGERLSRPVGAGDWDDEASWRLKKAKKSDSTCLYCLQHVEILINIFVEKWQQLS